MRLFKKMNAALALALTLALVAPVVTPVTTVAVAEAATIKLSKKKKNLKVGKSFKLKVKGTSEKATFASSDEEIAKVDAKGKVTAVSAGKATITATVADKEFTCKVTVKGSVNPAVANAPFEAKEVSIFSYTAALPKNWTTANTTIKGYDALAILPSNSDELLGGASILITSSESADSTQENFDLLKTYLEALITEEYVANSLGSTGTVSDFSQTEINISLGKALKTSYIVTTEVNGQTVSFTQTVYDIFADGYVTEITVTEGLVNTTPDLYEVADYLLNSLLYVK